MSKKNQRSTSVSTNYNKMGHVQKGLWGIKTSDGYIRLLDCQMGWITVHVSERAGEAERGTENEKG